MSKLLRLKTSWTFRLTESLAPRVDLQGGLSGAVFDIHTAKLNVVWIPASPASEVDRGCGGVEIRTFSRSFG
jgi:hypothetical protein